MSEMDSACGLVIAFCKALIVETKKVTAASCCCCVSLLEAELSIEVSADVPVQMLRAESGGFVTLPCMHDEPGVCLETKLLQLVIMQLSCHSH